MSDISFVVAFDVAGRLIFIIVEFEVPLNQKIVACIIENFIDVKIFRISRLVIVKMNLKIISGLISAYVFLPLIFS